MIVIRSLFSRLTGGKNALAVHFQIYIPAEIFGNLFKDTLRRDDVRKVT